ncbi:transmembrane channel-like protein 7 [Anthonomus grandis grandis]|uniref:transmembrane channel-like protein 7 n=1 Tax=Anthonomus grandis grandis TaxID=2921223 RepID=UPI0021652970|nr:transmembrane channel-like protein 7 [Anthonomus grandis grandis]XP_050296642.1 transmembrane channel-like protein 7 [Anthonomus grandis grandis]
MSGGEKKKKCTRSRGWEEAGAEFYQESYPGDADMEAIWKDPKRLATLLPSKQTRAVAATIRLRTNDTRTSRSTRTNKSTVRRHTQNRSHRRDSTVHRRASTIGGDVQVSMLPDLSEMRSNEETAWEEIMKIKELPIPMSKKREEKAKIMSEQHLRLQGFEQFRWKRKKAWQQFTTRITETYQKMELWRRDLKHIEGHFGTGVVAFFRFIKWLLFLNLFILLLVLFLIVLPTIFLDDRKVDCDKLENCYDKYFCGINKSHMALSIIQGTGQLEGTPLFYGFYPHEVKRYSIINTDMYYNIPLAYILTTVTYFLISLVAIVRTGAKGFRERLVQGEGQFYQYSNLIFGGWDFCIHNEKSARIKHKAIFTELKTLLETERMEEERQSRTRQERWRILFLRFLVNSTVLAVLALSGGVIYFVFNYATQQLKDLNVTNNETKMLQLLYEFLPSICIVALNISVPFIFQFLLSYEQYSPLVQIRMALIRTVFLRLAALLVFYVSMYSKIRCVDTAVDANQDSCYVCEGRPECWETFVGQQIYKLLLTDFAVQLGITFVINFLRSLLARHVGNKFIRFIGEQTFDLPKHALDVVYTQTLCWIGIFFAPLLSGIAFAIFFLLFYVKKFACLINCKPSGIVYRASRSTSMFMVVTLVSYAVALFPIAYTFSEVTPSVSCGPFRGLTKIWSLVENAFMDTPQLVQNIISFLTTPGFTLPVFIVLLLLLYYYTAVNSANRHMVTVLKNQLVLEGHDKKFLIDRLLMFIKQENDKRARLANRMMDGDTITNVSSIQS